MILLIPPKVLLILYHPANFQDFLCFLKCICSPFKWMPKGRDWEVCNSQLSVPITFFNFFEFSFKPISYPCPGKHILFSLQIFFFLNLKKWKKEINFLVFCQQFVCPLVFIWNGLIIKKKKWEEGGKYSFLQKFNGS